MRSDLIRAMSVLDPCEITGLLPKVVDWVSTRPLVLPTTDLIGELAIQALGCRENEHTVKALLISQFASRLVKDDTPYQDASIGWWETKEFANRFVPRLVERNWVVTVSTFLDHLDESISAQMGKMSSSSGGYDLTDSWLSESADGGEFWEAGDSIAFLAAQSLKEVARLPAASPEEVSGLLKRGDWAVFRRLRLCYLSTRAAGGILESAMLTALGDPTHAADYQPCPEYDSLLKAAFERGSSDARDGILTALALAAAEGGDHRDYWLFGRLAVIADHLPMDEQKRFEQFVERFGSPPEREPRTSIGFESPADRSPLDPDQADSMTALQLADYVRDWSPPEGDWFKQPSWKGLAAEVEHEAKQRPLEFSRAAVSFADLERTVVTALFRGLKNAIQDEASIDWDPMLHLMRLIAPQDEAINLVHEHRHGRDVSWSEAKRAALELLRTALGPVPSLPLTYKEPVWQTIETLAVNGEAIDHGSLDNARDSVFVALNSTRSQAVYAAVGYLLLAAPKRV